jgi:hypothetical protein
MEMINYTKNGTPFLNKVKIQPIVAKNVCGVFETISFLGTTTAKFDLEDLKVCTIDDVQWLQIIEINDLTSLESSDDDNRSWKTTSSYSVSSIQS